MVVVPMAAPNTVPLEEPIEAIAVALEVQVPPPELLPNVVVAPTHTFGEPVITPGASITVSTPVVVHPVAVNVNVMVDVPTATPPAVPVAPPIVATAGELLTHVPAPDGSVNVALEFIHNEPSPAIAAGTGFTVSTLVIVQPVEVSVNVIVVVPATTPPTVPVAPPIVAVAGVLLSQVPTPDASVRLAVVPGHTDSTPPIAAGDGFTVSTFVVVQPVDVSVNVIVVVPATTPPIVPVAPPIVAVAGVLLTHVPAPDASVNVTDVPGHTASAPPMAAGKGFTVSIFVVVHPVDVSVNVMVVVPATTPPIVPVPPPIVAVAGVLLTQVPTPEASVNVADVPGHTESAPPMPAGNGFTVSTAVAEQPVAVTVNVIVVVPAATPPTVPVAAPIVAVAGVLLTHVPAPDASVNVVDVPGHTESVPPMAAAERFTVSTFVAVHPVDVSVNVIVVVPATTPPIVPVAAPMVAVAGVLLTHVPTPDASVNVVVAPGHTKSAPPIAAGKGLTVSTFVMVQPVDVSVNVIVVVPATTPPIVPVPALIVAVAGALLTHVPAPDASVKVVVAPRHTESAPPMAFGSGVTVTACVAYTVPQPFDTP